MKKKNARVCELFHSAFDKKSYNKRYYQRNKDYWKEYYSKGKKPQRTDYWEKYYSMGSATGKHPNTELGRTAYNYRIKNDLANDYHKIANEYRNWSEQNRRDYPHLPISQEQAEKADKYQRWAEKKDDEVYRVYGDVRRLEKEGMLKNAGTMNARPSVQVKSSDVLKVKAENKAKQFVKDFKSGSKTLSQVSKQAVDSGKKAVRKR